MRSCGRAVLREYSIPSGKVECSIEQPPDCTTARLHDRMTNIKSMKHRVLVDMDGVLADVYTTFFELHEKETGEKLTMNDISGLLEAEAFRNQRRWVSTPGFFRHLPVMPGSRNVLKRLSDYFEIVVVSLATEFPNCLTDKLLWLHDNFPFISWKQIVFCGDKNIIEADIMIDDHFKNLDNFRGTTILFTQPHNVLLRNIKHIRVNSWNEIERLLLPPGEKELYTKV